MELLSLIMSLASLIGGTAASVSSNAKQQAYADKTAAQQRENDVIAQHNADKQQTQQRAGALARAVGGNFTSIYDFNSPNARTVDKPDLSGENTIPGVLNAGQRAVDAWGNYINKQKPPVPLAQDYSFGNDFTTITQPTG